MPQLEDNLRYHYEFWNFLHQNPCFGNLCRYYKTISQTFYLLTYLVRFQKPKLVDRSIAYAGIGATAIGTSGNRAGPAPVISEKSDKNSDKSLVTSDTTATGDNSSPDYDIQELLEAWKEYIREKVRNNVFQYHTHSAKIQIQILISI